MIVTGVMVKNARKARGWRQTQMALMLGIVRPQLSRLENSQQVPFRYVAQLDKMFGGQDWRKVQPTSLGDVMAIAALVHRIELLEQEVITLKSSRPRGRVREGQRQTGEGVTSDA